MATYKVHDEAVKHARKLIDAGTYDDTTDWSEAAPSPDDANTEINKETFGDFARWHLGINPEGSEGTKGRYASRYGDFTKVDGAARSSTPSSARPRMTTTRSRKLAANRP